MALHNTATHPILEPGSNITMSSNGKVILIDAVSAPVAAWLLASGGALTGDNTISGNFAKYFTGTGVFAIGINSGTAKFRVVGNNVAGTGELVRFDDNTPTNRFLLLENGALTLTGASGVRPLTITAVAEIGLRISNTGSFAGIQVDGAQSILNGQTSSAGVTNSRGYFTNRIDGGLGGNIIGTIWNIVPNSNTTANTALVEEFNIKPGNGGSTIVGGNYRFVVFDNTATPLITTGFDWATFNNSGLGTLTTRMRLRGNKLAVGDDFTPAATVDVLQSTLGDAAHKIASTATNDDPSVIVYQNRVATTDATVTTLHTITIPASTTVMLNAFVTARRTGGSSGTAEDGAGYNIRATFKNVAGTATQIGATTVVNSHEDQAGWDATFDVTAGTARVRVTGATNNNITWHLSKLEYMSVGS